MPKAESFQDLPLNPRSNDQQLRSWLFDQLRGAILSGRLSPGARLPSTRNLAHQYRLSRGTVTAAFDRLRIEGYITAQPGTGAFVADELPDHSMATRSSARALRVLEPTARVSSRALQMIDGVRPLQATRSVGKAFRSYEPAIDLFPVNLWARVAARVLRRAPRALYGQGDAAGYRPLRKAIAEYVGAARGVRCGVGQVIVTSGAQQALDLVARLLIDPGDDACVEDPCYPGARLALRAAGANVVAIPVDGNGLNIDVARTSMRNARIVYTTPENQFPLGVTMSPARRLALLDWAADKGAWIIEDEYDAEYRYFGSPVPALQSSDRSGCVIYVGTFTKMLFNALRVGFLVLPERLVDTFVQFRSFVDRHPPALEQAILAEFILEGHFGHHVRRMRQIYSERLATLREAAQKDMAGLIEVEAAPAGMRVMGWLKTSATDATIAQRARALGLELTALSTFTVRHPQPPGLILGFAGCSAAELRRGVRVLAGVLSGNSATHPTTSR